MELQGFTGNRRGPDDRRQNGLIEAMQKADDGNFLQAVAETVLQIIMDADVEALIGAGRHERCEGRLTYRNGLSRPDAGDAARRAQLGWERCSQPRSCARAPTSRLPGAAADGREGAGGGHPGGLDRRRLHPPG